MLVYDSAVDRLGLIPLAAHAHPRSCPFTDGGATVHGEGFGDRAEVAAAPTAYFPTAGVHQPNGLFEATVGNEFFADSILVLDLHSR